jgi:hypothetical protein
MAARIYNSDLNKELREGARLQEGQGSIPSEIAERVIPVMEVNPKLLRKINIIAKGEADNSVSEIIYTTPADSDFYMNSIQISMIKDVNSTSTKSYIQGVIDGETSARIFAMIKSISLTVQQSNYSVSFPIPVKMAKNSVISINNTTNVATVRAMGIITGYLVNNINA